MAPQQAQEQEDYTSNSNLDLSEEPDENEEGSFVEDDVSAMDDVVSVFSYTTNSTFQTEYTDGTALSCGKKAYVDPKVAVQEQRWVFWSKLLVALVLLSGLAATATGTFLVIRQGEYNDFVVQFQNYAHQIVAVSEENAANTFRSIAGLSVTITSFAEITKAKWPFVQIPNFDARAGAVESLSGVRLLAFAPVVTKDKKTAWEKFTAKNARQNFQDSIAYQNLNVTDVNALYLWPYVYQGDLKTFQFSREEGEGPYLPMWQLSRFRPELSGMINYNLNDEPRVQKAFATTSSTKSPTMNFFVITGTADSILVQPIFETVLNENGNQERKVVGILWCLIDWLAYFHNIVADQNAELIAVVKSTDKDAATYQINGLQAKFLGEGDLHDPKYNSLQVSSEFAKLDIDDSIHQQLPRHLKVPALSVHLYPTDNLKKNYETYNAHYYTGGVVAIFVFTSLVFALFDHFVRRQQAKVMERVIQQDKIVSNLFPEKIRDRLYGPPDGKDETLAKTERTIQNGFPDVLDPNDFTNPEVFNSPPIADLFPSATIFFCDIAGFTAWSSQREPPQVFMLLESLYGAFDKIAYKHGIFKVETTGDCYVGVCGLPEPRKRHATATARFARDCMAKFTEMILKLEITLGPDTGDLQMRAGLHSGQVTAGVLRGERARFQLFGDTVNTASRMETTSRLSRIQISATTAELLRKEGKSKWITPRSEKVSVKGKGLMQTCWLKMKRPSNKEEEEKKMEEIEDDQQVMDKPDEEPDDDNSQGSEEDYDYDNELPEMKNQLDKGQRLVEWSVEVLTKLLQQIVASRPEKQPAVDLRYLEKEILSRESVALDEFQEIVSLPKFASDDLKTRKDPDSVLLPLHVISQLRSYVSQVSEMYLENPFHNFEHASHVAASVKKMLTRIVTHTDDGQNSTGGDTAGSCNSDSELVDLAGHSYGITSDPLTQFAVIFSALIHDAEHPGVPNTQLVKEKTPEAEKYQKSVAEQNSIHKAWDLLMEEQFADLRATIYSTEDELRRFRQMVINVVLATDICDKELGALRKNRWNVAFSESGDDDQPEVDVDRKATIVLEHLIQASDVSHTMQHWQIYLHWNEKFFFELYGAYKEGRAETDPTLGWYKGEIGFYDYYIIPLAKKLDSCGVFGVSSDEYLNYAQLNRDEWEREGEAIVEEFKEKYYAQYPEHRNLPLKG